MESIYGPGLPRMTPPIRPTPSPDQDVHGAGSGDAPVPSTIPAEPPRLTRPIEPSAVEAAEGPPPGVDPDMWSVLTAEEREFFSVAREMGPITYGRDLSAANEASLPRGRRLDVRA